MSASLLDAAIAAARAGGDVLLRHWRSLSPDDVSEKRHNDFVTQADRGSEDRIVSDLRARFPGDGFLAEEGGTGGGPGNARRVWIIDPLDGTSNFIAGFPFWCVSVAARENGEMVAGVVWDPLREELYACERGGGAFRNGVRLRVRELPDATGSFLATGFPFRSRDQIDRYLGLFRELFLEARAIRRAGSAALDLANVAAGVFDGFFEFRLSIWDIAAGALLIEEAGGTVTDFEGGDRHWETGDVVAGSAGVAAAIRAAAARATRRGLEAKAP